MAKILFFGGKGGVGKTSCSGAYAVSRANMGKKVLLVSTDPAHSTSDLFEQKIGSDVVKLMDNLYSTEVNPEEESEKYIEKIRKQVRMIYSPIIVQEIEKQLDGAKISPGSHEAALFDKMVEIINEGSKDYDYIIFDTAPTGHTVRLLTLPKLLESWIESLLAKRRKTLMYKEMYERDYSISDKDDIIDILQRRRKALIQAKDSLDQSGFVFVLNAEKLAIDETRKATELLKKYQIPIAAYVVNRILPDDMHDDFWKSKKAQEKMHLDEIEKLFSERHIYKIPLLPKDMASNEVMLLSKYFDE